jgi:hypothetical protein
VRALGLLLRSGSGRDRHLRRRRASLTARALAKQEDVGSHLTPAAASRSGRSTLYHSHDVLLFLMSDEPFASVPWSATSCGCGRGNDWGTPEAVSDDDGLVAARSRGAGRAVRRLAGDRPCGSDSARAAGVVRERFEFDGYVGRLETCYERLVARQRGREAGRDTASPPSERP